MNDLETRLRTLSHEASKFLPEVLEPGPSDLRRIGIKRRLATITFASLTVLVIGVASVATFGTAGRNATLGVSGAASKSAVSLHPQSVHAGEEADLRVERVPAGSLWGLSWSLEKHDGQTWVVEGLLVAGPGWESVFYVGSEANEVIVEGIGFDQPATMQIKIPSLEPGRYRLGQTFLTPDEDGEGDPTEEPHYAEFEVQLPQG